MGYAKKLERKFKGLSQLTGGTLQKRRDKLNQSGVHYEKQTATFNTYVRATVKRSGCSKPPRPL